MIQVFEDSSTRLLSLGLTNLRVAYKPVGLVRTAGRRRGSLTILRFANRTTCTAKLCNGSKPYGFVSTADDLTNPLLANFSFAKVSEAVHTKASLL